MYRIHYVLLIVVWHSCLISGRHPTCHFLFEMQLAKRECLAKLEEELVPDSKGCRGTWDNISCWNHAEVGDVVVNACPGALRNLFGRDGNISRNCTASGWSEVYPSISSVCYSDSESSKQSGRVRPGTRDLAPSAQWWDNGHMLSSISDAGKRRHGPCGPALGARRTQEVQEEISQLVIGT